MILTIARSEQTNRALQVIYWWGTLKSSELSDVEGFACGSLQAHRVMRSELTLGPRGSWYTQRQGWGTLTACCADALCQALGLSRES